MALLCQRSTCPELPCSRRPSPSSSRSPHSCGRTCAEAGPGPGTGSLGAATDAAVPGVPGDDALGAHALAERGALQAAPSRGWFLADEVSTATSTTHVEGFADYARRNNIPLSAKVLMSRVRRCTAREAKRLRLEPGTDLFEMRRLRSLNGLVVVLEHNRLPLGLCPALPETDFTTASLYATLLTASPPQIPRRAEYAVEAGPPTARSSARWSSRDPPFPS